MEPWSATALLLGLGGSLHCVGMCGPLALALGGGADRRLRFVLGRLLYNGGRVVTYVLMGGLFGGVGGAIRWAGWQQGLSIGLGVALLAGVVLGRWRRQLGLEAWIARPVGVLKAALGRLLRLESLPGLFVVGLLNGLLPCGLVYLALAGSLASGGAVQGMVYMGLFGAGTVPLLLATSLLGRLLLRYDLRAWSVRLLPAGMAVLGVLFVLRGLGLGIPFVSPVLDGNGGGMHHH